MVVDRLSNWSFYRGLPERLLRALEFLSREDLAQLPLGRIDLEGDHLFALVQEYTTRPENECRWEAHRKYCDVQYVVSGCERIGVAPLDNMTVDMPYDVERDVGFFHGEGDWLTLRAGTFAIFAPQDVHRPCAQVGAGERVRKIVFKAALDS